MIIIKNNETLHISFPEIDPDCEITIGLERTLRIPDDGRTYPLPASLGNFPLRHVDDLRLPERSLIRRRGGVAVPMYQAEALWLSFDGSYVSSREVYWPFAVKVAAGKINAVSGEPWTESLIRAPQSYLVAPDQPWLDGFASERGVVRQFVAVRMGDGITAEEQITGSSEWGGVQIQVFPMSKKAMDHHHPVVPQEPKQEYVAYSTKRPEAYSVVRECSESMGLAAGGRIKQELIKDPYPSGVWSEISSRCFIHLISASDWVKVAGETPPQRPPTAADYNRHGLPWFDAYRDTGMPLPGSLAVRRLLGIGSFLPETRNSDQAAPRIVREINLDHRRGVSEGKW